MLQRVKAMAETIVLRESSSTHTPKEPVALGTLGEYELLQKLGEGGMGAVYKARHTRLDKLVALKVLPGSAMRDSECVARFEREMKAVGRLEHPHIVRAMDAGQVGGRHYLVMEYIDGLDLSEVAQRCGTLRVADACEAIRQAALGLRYADEHAMVHRDIKPSNLVLDADGLVKILDLGLALVQADRLARAEPPGRASSLPPTGVSAGSEITSPSRIVGTLDYIAPEQCWDSHEVDIRADIYSLGCTLYKLLTGQPPFGGPQYKSTFEKMMAHVQVPVPPLRGLRKDVPEKLAAVVDRMLAKKRDDRYALPVQVVEALQPYCLGCDLVGLLARARKGAQGKPRPSVSTDSPVTALRGSPEADTDPPARAAKASAPPAAPQPAKDTGGGESFDAYYKWLGIPPDEQPPNHYRLLGIRVFEEDREVIQVAAEGRTAHLKTRGLGRHALLSQELLNEVQQAKLCLLTPEEKIAYDAGLRQKLEAEAATKSESQVPWPPVVPSPMAATTRRATGRSQLTTLFAKAKGISHVVRSLAATGKRTHPTLMLICAAAAAAAVCLGLILYIATDRGKVRIELSDPAATVEVKVDGNQVDAAGLKEPLSLSTSEHEHRAMGALVRRMRQYCAQRQFPEDPDTIWAEYRFFGPASGDSQSPAIAAWGPALVRNWNEALKTVEELVPETEPPRYRIVGPLALMHSKCCSIRTAGMWRMIEGLDVLVRREGQWRSIAGVEGDWQLGPDDRFQPADEDHRKIQDLFNTEARIYRERNVKLLEESYHPLHLAIYPDAQDSAKAVVSTYDDVRAAVEAILRRSTPWEHVTEIQRIKVQGPLALVLRETKHFQGKEPEQGEVSLAVCCHTTVGWRVCLQLPGDVQEVLSIDGQPSPRVAAGRTGKTGQASQPADRPETRSRWLGYGVGKASVAEIAAYTNIVWGGSDEVCEAAKAADLKVVLPFEGKDEVIEEVQNRILDSASRHREVVVAVCWEMPDVGGGPAKVAAFGRKLKDVVPGVQLWCNLPWWSEADRRFPLPEEVDALLVEMGYVTSPEEVMATADRGLPERITKAAGRPVMVVWWHGHKQKRNGLVPLCRPGTMRALGEVVDKYGLKGLFLVGYETGSQGAVGIGTSPTLVSEIKEIGKKWEIRAPASGHRL